MHTEKQGSSHLPAFGQAVPDWGRRARLRAVTWAGGADYALLPANVPARAVSQAGAETGSNLIIASDSKVIGETTHGKVRGCYRSRDLHVQGHFVWRPSGGQNRFQPPTKPARWAEVHSSLYDGPVSPQGPAFTTEKVPTMIFDKVCELKNDPDGEVRRTLLG